MQDCRQVPIDRVGGVIVFSPAMTISIVCRSRAIRAQKAQDVKGHVERSAVGRLVEKIKRVMFRFRVHDCERCDVSAA